MAKLPKTSATPLGTLHQRRVRTMLWVGSLLMVVLGVSWGLFFAYKNDWVIVVLDSLMVATGVGVWSLTRHNRTRAAFYLLLLSMFVLVTGISLFFDIPSAAAPRSTHQFLLVIAVCALLFLKDEQGVLRHWVAGVCFVTYVVLACAQGAITMAYALPDSIRVGGTWVNTVASIVALFVMVQIMSSDIAGISTLELEMRKGIARREFFLLYQPQVTSVGKVVGAEALLRWQHPQRGLVSPVEFISVAETTGLMVPLGLQALNMACKELVAWSEHPELSHLTLSVNVSAQQFCQTDFVEQVHSIMVEAGVRPHRLKLELTESLLVNDVDDIVHKMAELRSLGVGFSLDDFGTGYSSLSYLKRLPLDQLKIDQSFVRDVLTDTNDAAIARTVINLGKSLGFAVIAEGVETQGQREFLMDNDCHIFQGYLFSKPLPVHQFLAFVQDAQAKLSYPA